MTVSRLREALRAPLPGLPVQMGMAARPRPGTERILDPSLDCRRAGVLVLLYPVERATHLGGASHVAEEDDLCLVLTRRTDALDNHRGQISFPGGSMDPGETAQAAAIRETWEELGVNGNGLKVLGALSPLYIPPSGFCIYPTVAYSAQRPAFVPNPAEVAEVLEVSLAHLLDPATRQEETWELRGQPVRVPFYVVGHHKVWGATAMVLCELLAVVRVSTP
ncbi:MAG: CoA pyrophosphatase [Chloroflexi bacterium]|nr:CoA pyrophosphatase [Chloroflexota bacterium]